MFRRAKLMLENVPNTHDSKRHQRASLRQTLVAETIVEPWLLGWRWDAICSHSKLSCSSGCRPVARPGARCWDGAANRWLDSLCRGSGAPVFPRDLALIQCRRPEAGGDRGGPAGSPRPAPATSAARPVSSKKAPMTLAHRCEVPLARPPANTEGARSDWSALGAQSTK